MLVVRVELWPGGDKERAEEISRLLIWNISACDPISNYQWVALDATTRGFIQRSSGRITGHERSKGAWSLLHRVLAGVTRAPRTFQTQPKDSPTSTLPQGSTVKVSPSA